MKCLGRLALAVLLALSISTVFAQSKVDTLNLTFTTINVPGAMNTVVTGINSAGDMVGYYYNGSGPGTGFLLSSGSFSFFSYPYSGASTQAYGINDGGLISGTAYIAQGTGAVGFLYDGTTFTTIRVPDKTNTIVDGINNAADLVGGDGDFGANQAFERIGTKFRNVTPPPRNYIIAVANGINNLGEIVGSTTAASTNGFALMHGRFQTIAFRGATMTAAWGVNDGGIIVGTYESASGFAGFAVMDGKYLSFNYPGAMCTFANGINNAGEVVGSYSIDGQTFHGFVTSPVTSAGFGPSSQK